MDDYGVTDGVQWTPQKTTLFDGHYLRNRSTLDIGVLGYIGIVKHKKHSPEVWSIPPGTPCIYILIISSSVLLRMRNILDKICGENKNKHFVSHNFCYLVACRL